MTTGDVIIHKDELIHIHSLLVQIRNLISKNGYTDDFIEYDALKITPLHIHRSKAEHKHAIFILGKELATSISSDESSGPQRVSLRMSELAERALAQNKG